MLKTFSLTDTGIERKLNQDYVFTSETPVGALPNLFIVADGMGGHKAGDRASRVAVETLIKAIEEAPNVHPELSSFNEIISAAIRDANSEVRTEAAANENYEGMGTTMVIACIDGDLLRVANVGDSRLYIIDREIRQVTNDHSIVAELVRSGELDRDLARVHPNKNLITRAVGAEDEICPDFFEEKLKEGDIVLMCTDGLTNMLEDEEIRLIVHVERDLVGIAEGLVERANDHGGADNITVALLEPFA